MVTRILQAYSLFVVLWFLSNRLIQDSWFGLVILDKFAAYFLAASIPAFIAAIFVGRKEMMLYATPPLAICAYFYLPFFFSFPITQTMPSDGYVRVATYNIWNQNRDIEAIVQVINDSEADIIAIQELTETQQSHLVESLSSSYPYFHVSKPVYGGTTALFSRHELFSVVEIDFDIDRPAILADFKWKGKTFSIVSAHLNPSFWAYHQQPWIDVPKNYSQYIKDQNKQARIIVSELEERTGSSAKFIACDCNSQETASTNRLLRSSFSDTFRSLGWQIGEFGESDLKYERDLWHIDYIWYSGDISPVAIYRSKEAAGSDHKPVYADFYAGN